MLFPAKVRSSSVITNDNFVEMDYYYTTNYYYEPNKARNFRGRPRATQPSTLHQDIQSIVGFKLKLKRDIAFDRAKWTIFINTIYDAAKAENFIK